MHNVRPGDVLLYPVTIRAKGSISYYYGCEVAGNLSGDPPAGVRAIYRREEPVKPTEKGRILLARHEDDPDEKLKLARELEKIYGPGELVTGVPCSCALPCSALLKHL